MKTLAEAGIDFIKDDELMADPPHSPFDERVDAVMRVINAHAERTGKKVMYAFNISDELDAMQRHYEKIVRSGGTCAMISLNSVGLAGAKKICDLGALAIHGHRNGWGMLNRHPLLGIEFPAYQKLWRLAGVDQIHVNGIANKFWESDDSVVRSIESCLKPLLGGTTVLPVVSSGQWGGQAPETFRRTRTVDLLYMAGGGIMAHPERPGGRRALAAKMVGGGGGRLDDGTGGGEISGTENLGGKIRKEKRLSKLLLAFYGDDFTGSTDALEQLTLAGIRTALFIEPPSAAQLKKFPGLQAVGVAGMTRSLAPDSDGARTRAGVEEIESARRAARSLQSLFHVRFVAENRQHRSRD